MVGIFLLILIVPAITSQTILLGILVAFILAAVFGTFIHFKLRRERLALRAVAMADVDTMTGVQFENYVAEIFKSQGYHVDTTPTSGDYGVDLLLKKNHVRTAIQLKRYGKPVNLKAVQEVVAGMKMAQYHASKSMVVTNNSFAASAVALAAIHGCELVDRVQLGEWIRQFQQTR